MSLTNLIASLSLLMPFFIFDTTFHSNLHGINQVKTEWIISELISKETKGIQIKGNPLIVSCKYGKALQFNGSTDGIFLDSMPLTGLQQFTVEALVRPDSGGNFEQRFFHCGEVKGDRVLLELRSVQTGWYFDAFVKSGGKNKALIDSSLLHAFNQWFHLAFVISKGKIETYINGKKELESNIDILPIQGGRTSIGVRQNEQSWFKGAIYKIRISPEPLKPDKFIAY